MRFFSPLKVLFAAVFLSGALFGASTDDLSRYKDRDFTILDASQATMDGASAIIVTFSAPLAKNLNLDKLIKVSDNKTKTLDASWQRSKSGGEIYMKFLEPDTLYHLSIDNSAAKQLKNIVGTPLLYDNYTTQIRTRAITPMVGFTSSSSLLPDDFTDGLPVTTLNVNQVDVDFFRIDQNALPYALSTLFGSNSIYNYYADEIIKRGGKLVYSGRFDLGARKNVKTDAILPIKNIKALQYGGIYIAIMKQSGKYYQGYYLPATIFAPTNIGVIAHKTQSGYDIFTQNLLNGAAMPNVNIKILDQNGKVMNEYKSDKKGFISIPNPITKDRTPHVIIASGGGKTSFLYLNSKALDLSEFDIGGAINYNKTLFSFGPRDLYRAGEKVYVNAILRTNDGKIVPNQPIKVDIVQADSKIARSFTWQGKEGFYQYEYDLPQNAPSGMWRFKFDLGDNTSQYYSFNVEDFMPEKMALEINASEPVLKDDEVQFSVFGKYLYGAPAAKNQLVGPLSSKPLRAAVESLKGFYFGDIKEQELSRNLGFVDTTLDDEGRAVVNVENSWSDIRSPINVIFQASLMESGGRPVTRTAVQKVFPAAELPAIKPNFGQKSIYNYSSGNYENEFSVDEDSRAEFEIVFTNQNGERLAKKDLQVTLIKERRDYYWYWSDGGWNYNYNQRDIPIETVTISTEKGKSANVAFDVEWGSYVAEVTDKDTGATSSVRFWAGYSWQESGGRGESRPEEIKIKINKPAYKAGDIAKVTLNSPQSGSGYLIVESNEGILWWKSIAVEKEGSTFDIPIAKNWSSHDIYITASVVRGGSKNLRSTPKRALGILHLPLFREDRKLDINLSVPSKITPNQKVKITLKTALKPNQKGKKIMAIVSAVDSGILSITGFKTPDPFKAFFQKRALNVDIYDVYGNLIEGSGKNAKLKFGGDVAMARAGKKPVTTVQIVAFQSAPVTLNDKGEAVVEMQMPDFNGELTFMAQAWSVEDYGSSDTKSIIAAPVVVELGYPRFLGSGDESVLSLDINNLSGLKQSMKISLRVSGFLANTGEDSYTIALSDKQKKTIKIPVKALSGFGGGDITVNVSGIVGANGAKDSLERKWTVGVRPPFAAKTYSFTKVLEPNDVLQSSEYESEYEDLDQRATEAKISITATPPLNLAQTIGALFAYPYGCLEQTTSGIYPSIYVSSQQLKELGIRTSTDEERRRNVEKGIERLLGMQKSNGAFGFWGNEGSEAYWGSVYATDFLIRAKTQGYNVPQAALKNAQNRLLRYINNDIFNNSYSDDIAYTSFAVKAYSAFVLAREQKVSLSALRSLYDKADGNKSALSLMQLGVALKLMGDEARAQELFKRALDFKGYSDDYRWYGDYGSLVRDKALVLSLMYEYNIEPQKRTRLLLELSKDISTKRYFSTQERNSIFLAGRHLLNAAEPNWTAVIDAKGKKEEIKPNGKAFVRNYDFAALKAVQSIQNKANGTLFASVDIVGYPVKAPQPYSNKVDISRQYYTLDGTQTKLSEMKSGDLIVVVLKVTTELGRLPDALVVDLLPAGLELENQNLGLASAGLQNSALFSANSELSRQVAKTTILHQEFRDDRYVASIDVGEYSPATLVYLARAVTAGDYTVPGPYVESMYNPEYFAIGQSEPNLRVK